MFARFDGINDGRCIAVMFQFIDTFDGNTAGGTYFIAYVLKYIQAAMQAGIEMGVYPKDAMRMVEIGRAHV